MSKPKSQFSGGETNKFWMVWNIDGLAPTSRHDSSESAGLEANRLAEKHPNQRFAVLQSVVVKIAAINPVQSLRCVKTPAPF